MYKMTKTLLVILGLLTIAFAAMVGFGILNMAAITMMLRTYRNWLPLVILIISGIVAVTGLGIIIKAVTTPKKFSQVVMQSHAGEVSIDRKAVQHAIEAELESKFLLKNVKAEVTTKRGNKATANVDIQERVGFNANNHLPEVEKTIDDILHERFGLIVKKIHTNVIPTTVYQEVEVI